MGRPLWQIDADLRRLQAEKKAARTRTFKPGMRLRSFKPEAKGQRDPRQVDPGFMAWLHVETDCIACLIEGRPGQPSPIEAAHQKLAIAAKGWREGGLGPRVHDHRCAPLCAWHHRLAPNSCDTGGQRKFWDHRDRRGRNRGLEHPRPPIPDPRRRCRQGADRGGGVGEGRRGCKIGRGHVRSRLLDQRGTSGRGDLQDHHASPRRPTAGDTAVSVDRNDCAAAMFPADWARMEQMTGKRRSRMRATLRNRAVYQAGLAALPASASCAPCAHHGRYPTDKRMTCDLDSDFHGYAIVKPDHKCPRWATKDTPQ